MRTASAVEAASTTAARGSRVRRNVAHWPLAWGCDVTAAMRRSSTGSRAIRQWWIGTTISPTICTSSVSNASVSSVALTAPSSEFSIGTRARSTRPSWTASTASWTDGSGTGSKFSLPGPAYTASWLYVPAGPRKPTLIRAAWRRRRRRARAARPRAPPARARVRPARRGRACSRCGRCRGARSRRARHRRGARRGARSWSTGCRSARRRRRSGRATGRRSFRRAWPRPRRAARRHWRRPLRRARAGRRTPAAAPRRGRRGRSGRAPRAPPSAPTAACAPGRRARAPAAARSARRRRPTGPRCPPDRSGRPRGRRIREGQPPARQQAAWRGRLAGEEHVVGRGVVVRLLLPGHLRDGDLDRHRGARRRFLAQRQRRLRGLALGDGVDGPRDLDRLVAALDGERDLDVELVVLALVGEPHDERGVGTGREAVGRVGLELGVAHRHRLDPGAVQPRRRHTGLRVAARELLIELRGHRLLAQPLDAGQEARGGGLLAADLRVAERALDQRRDARLVQHV